MMNEIIKAVELYDEALHNLDRIRKEYAEEPDLLGFYEPSAKILVEETRKNIKNLREQIKEDLK